MRTSLPPQISSRPGLAGAHDGRAKISKVPIAKLNLLSVARELSMGAMVALAKRGEGKVQRRPFFDVGGVAATISGAQLRQESASTSRTHLETPVWGASRCC